MKEFNELPLKSVLFVGEIARGEALERERDAPACCLNWHRYCTGKNRHASEKEKPK
ncbi:MAG: hypothetical protein ACN4GG_00885 [Akkermansiaceae bacterium]